ncbi:MULTISPECIES: polysaccharide biosynthesis protein [Sanguibacteroides]|uniref:Capsule biosynthesis protein CapD n=1 Tax=Sanguibacteroides justesenii TaxID=1547597 RepID=A0A0C3NKG2_9PORP|nr:MULTISPECIES: nucleoside-diphosphate sugar epimerase/dehydratase [Sanguibacteroides]KIO46707.1 capsule biosynthesis protein CapD [Sanguibacteroides justesenii]KIO46906.1 capsule biosynthesis protein CapD [Sanguibacteroides justesenii]PXZ43532.1 polysaccharide biosynthesis protein [Sanguibacteroides justesenii]
MNELFELRSLASKIVHSRYISRWIVLAIDLILSVGVTLFVYFIIMYVTETPIKAGYVGGLTVWSAVYSLLAFLGLHAYRGVVRHTTLQETWRIGVAIILKVILLYFTIHWIIPEVSVNRLLLGGIIDLNFSAVVLVSLRVLFINVYEFLKTHSIGQVERVLIYGMDSKSASLNITLSNNFLPNYRVVGYLTIGRRYKHYRLSGVSVYSVKGEESFNRLVRRLQVKGIVFPDYWTAQDEQDRLVRFCQKRGLEMLILPGIEEVYDGNLPRPRMKTIRLEDLLGRDEIRISMREISAKLEGKVVMVTGAAGSIGSELCRQLTRFKIRQLILFDSAETPMHNIQLEFTDRYPGTSFVPVIGDVRSPERVDFVFRKYHPQVVFHAAAYKHVPLMELNPCEAVLVNVCGTCNMADYSVKYGVDQFVMISTDKAVNPTNVMGASKRLAEIYVQSLSVAIRDGKYAGRTRFITTRFGNVLGSNGSVIPRFREQIRNGGPVTVTHPDIIRYFMTIPEACRLVLEAGTMGDGGEIFIFEMGKPVKIADMARRMIELSGFVPDKEIKIVYTGLRPGEKLYEELLSNKENTSPTMHDKIRIAKVREYDYEEIKEELKEICELSSAVNIPEMICKMKMIVPEYISKNSEFEKFDKVHV